MHCTVTFLFILLCSLAFGAERAEMMGVARWGALRFSPLRSYELRLSEIDREIRHLPRASDLDARGTHGYHSNFTAESRTNWFELTWAEGQWVESLALVPTRINTQSGTFSNYGFPRSLLIEAQDMEGKRFTLSEVADTRLDLRWGDPLFLSFPRQKIRSLRVIPTDLPELMDKKNVRGFSVAECFVFDQQVNQASKALLRADFSIDGEPGWNIRYLTDLQSPLGPPEMGEVGLSLGWHSDLRIIDQQEAWIEIDLGDEKEFDSFRIFGARGDAPLKGPGFGFPQRMRFEIRSKLTDQPRLLWEPNDEVIPNPGYNVLDIPLSKSKARYVRLIVEKPDKPDVLSIARVLISEWEIRDGQKNIALYCPVTSNDGYESIPHDSLRVWSRKGINDGYTSSGRIISYHDWVYGLSRRFDLRVERDELMKKIALIESRSRHIVLSILITILSLIIASLILILRRNHRQSVKKMKQLRMSISSDLHDEVGSNLATISLLADLPQKPGEASALKDVKRLATETSLSLREIVDLTLADRPRRPLDERMRDIAKLMLCDHRWQFEANQCPDLGPLQRRDLIFYFKEALHNIIQHASAENVTIRIVCSQGNFLLEISDDGKGFHYDPQKSLLTLHQRSNSLNGQLQVTSRIGEGTTLQLRFPATPKKS